MATTLVTTDLYRLVQGRHGRFLVNPRDIYIGRSLVEYGEFAEVEWQILDQLLPKGAVVAEVGANIGALTVPMAKKIGENGLVYAIEPQILVFQLLASNVALNDLTNVHVMNAAAIGPKVQGWAGVARLNPRADTNFGGVRLKDVVADRHSTRVRMEALDTMLSPKRLDLLKVDVEGMEREVLLGAAGLMREFRPILYVENRNAGTSPDLIEHILGQDYKLWWHLPLLFNEANYAGRSDNVLGGVRSFNMLCLPSTSRRQVDGLRAVAGPEDHPMHWASQAATMPRSGTA